MRLILHWILSALLLLLVAYFVPGFHVSGFLAALIAAAVIALINATLGAVLKFLTFPLTVLTLGIFWFVINALMLELATWFVPGFRIDSFKAAFLGAILLALLNLVVRALTKESKSERG
jgi:putative membrane protein